MGLILGHLSGKCGSGCDVTEVEENGLREARPLLGVLHTPARRSLTPSGSQPQVSPGLTVSSFIKVLLRLLLYFTMDRRG